MGVNRKSKGYKRKIEKEVGDVLTKHEERFIEHGKDKRIRVKKLFKKEKKLLLMCSCVFYFFDFDLNTSRRRRTKVPLRRQNTLVSVLSEFFLFFL